MHPVLRLVRLGNTLVSFFGTAVAGLVALGAGLGAPTASLVAIVLAGGSTACVTAAGNVLNDLGDREGDRVNHPDRPLVTGAIRPQDARRLTAGLFVASVVLVLPVLAIHPALAPVLGAAIGALLLYEFRWKARGLVGNALVAGLTAAVFLYGGAAVGTFGPVLPLAAMAFLATLSRELIKDMEDSAGDVGRSTFPRVHGMRPAGAAARLAVAAAIALSPVPLLTVVAPSSVAGIIYLGLVGASDALFVASVAMLPDRLHLEQTLSKGAMTVALLAFLATAFR